MCRCLAVAPYPEHTNSLAMCLNVIACNHLILSLNKAGGPPMKPLLFSRHPSDIALTTSDIAYIYPNRSNTILPSQRDVSTHWNHGQTNLTLTLDGWHETQRVHGTTVGASLEVNYRS